MAEKTKEQQESEQAERIVQNLRKQGNLPAYSDNVKSICQTSDNDSANVRDLSKIIMRDAGLTTNVLSTINSALYGLKFPVKTVTASVNLLGFEKVRALALGLTLFQETIPNKKDQKLLGLYASSYFSGSFSMALAQEIKFKAPEEVFVAGLLNQLPLMSLANSFPEEFQEMEALTNEGVAQDVACSKAFRTSYAAICQAVTSMYNLKGKAAEIVSQTNPNDELSQLVKCAGKISSMLFNQLDESTNLFSDIEKEIKSILNVKKFDLDAFIKKTCMKDDNLQRFFHIGEKEIKQLISAIHDPNANSPNVSLGILFGDDFKKTTQVNERKKIKQEFLTELTLCREKQSLNELLAMSMESLFRCIDDSDIFLLLLNQKAHEMQGRYYMGQNNSIDAAQCKVPFEHKQSPIITCMFTNKPVIWSQGQPAFHLPLKIFSTLMTSHAMLIRIMLDKKPVGCFFISRKTNKAYTNEDIEWFGKVVEQVNKAFLKGRSKSHN